MEFLPAVFMLLSGGCLLYLFYRRYWQQQSDFENFALLHHFVPDLEPSVHGGLFAIAAPNAIYPHVYNGVIAAQPVTIFEWLAEFDNQTDRRLDMLVAKTNFGEVLPDFYLYPKVMRGVLPVPEGRGIGQVTLEGTFSKDFELYIQQGAAVESLEFFTPDFMELLQQQGARTLLFSNHGTLYWLRLFYLGDSVAGELDAVYELLVAALPKLQLKAATDDFSTAPVAAVGAPSVAASGNLKIPTWMLAATLAVWLVCVAYVMLSLFR
jgi:hypothetical protein